MMEGFPNMGHSLVMTCFRYLCQEEIDYRRIGISALSSVLFDVSEQVTLTPFLMNECILRPILVSPRCQGTNYSCG